MEADYIDQDNYFKEEKKVVVDYFAVFLFYIVVTAVSLIPLIS